MILVVDNFDSFTWNLVDYISRTGEKVSLIRNDVHPDYWQFDNIKGIVLSPGPGKPEDAGYLFEVLKTFENKVPILGICLGHQAIGQFFGASIEKAPMPMHGKISKIECDLSSPIFKDIPYEIDVVRYHSLILNNIPKNFNIIANYKEIIMAISHIKLPIYGIQFHPEAFLTENGLRIIENWVKICKEFRVELI